jgi:hypothetical protein
MYVLSNGKLTTIATATIRKYGDAAYENACSRASVLEAMKDETGARFWHCIAETIRKERSGDMPMMSA